MAWITKSRARKPLAEGELTLGTSSAGAAMTFSFGTWTDEEHPKWLSLRVDVNEAKQIAVWIARSLTITEEEVARARVWPDKVSDATALRRLADVVEIAQVPA